MVVEREELDGLLLPVPGSQERVAPDMAALQPAEGRPPTNEADEPEQLNVTAEVTYHHSFTSGSIAGRSCLSEPDVSLRQRKVVTFAKPQRRHSTGSPNKMDSDM